jgi:LysR family glycine cleavage system transcriptional activator
MSVSLPSLTALRAFEVAGRLQSFSNAALELNVTQGAVSRQIRALEDELGVKLFVRTTRRVVLSEAGRSYLAEVQYALGHIQRATEGVRQRDARSTLTISVLPSFGSFWLMPRLAHFTQRYAGIDTRVVSTIGAVNLHAREADIAIRVGALPGKVYAPDLARVELTMVTDWRGVLAEALAPDMLVPVFSSALGPPRSAFREPADAIQFPLIHTASRPSAWPDWITAHGLPELPAARTIEYGHFFMSLAAAREGRGIAIVPDILLSDTNMQDLIPLTQFKVQSAAEYYVLSLSERSEERGVRLFRQWMQEQIVKQ